MFKESLMLAGSIGDSPEDSEEEPEDGGRDHRAEPGTGAAAGVGVLMELGGFEEGREGEGAVEQVVIEEEQGDTTEIEEQPSSEEKDTEEVGCSEGVSVECQAWREATLIARGEMVVPHLRSRKEGTQEQTWEEVQVMATVVGAEEGCRTPLRG